MSCVVYSIDTKKNSSDFVPESDLANNNPSPTTPKLMMIAAVLFAIFVIMCVNGPYSVPRI